MSFMDALGSFTVGALEAMGTIIDATAQYKATEQLVNKLGNEALMNGAKRITISIDGVTKEFTSDSTIANRAVSNTTYDSMPTVSGSVLSLFDGACRHAGNNIGRLSWTAHINSNTVRLSTSAGAHIDLTFVDKMGHPLDIRSYNHDQVAGMLISHGINRQARSATPASFHATDSVDNINWNYYTPYGSILDATRVEELIQAIMR